MQGDAVGAAGKIGDPVGAATGPEHKDIRPVTARQHVIACAAGQGVGARVARQLVIVVAPPQGVVSRVARDLIGVAAAPQPVVAIAAHHPVGAATAIMLVLALADYLFQRFKFMRDNMMTLTELKDEMKESEGDQYVKQRQRQIRNERARKRMMQAVPKADVVVTNPTHYAVALRYKPDEGDAAPVVLAKGVEAVALRIRELAAQHNIPLYEDPPLARLLFAQAEIDEPIPLQTYELVARVIAFVAELRTKRAA